MNIIRQYWKSLTVPVVAGIFAIIDYLFKWGIIKKIWDVLEDLANLVIVYPIHAGFVTLFVLIIYLWINLNKLSNHVALKFKDNFKRNLNKKWDYEGHWELVGNELLVTQSEIGGITKVGQLWTDYRFEFDAVIVNDRIGWIVRAQDHFNYYMIQLTPELIRVHLRLQSQWLLLRDHPHNLKINTNQSIHIRTDVRGSEIRIYLNGTEVYYDNSLFSMKPIRIVREKSGSESLSATALLEPNTILVPSFTTGRVGFRMANQESGRISRCRVRPI